MAYYLGDPVALGVTIRDTAGAPASATTVVCTIALPDGETTETPTVSNPSTGNYTVTYTPEATGIHLVRWVASGTNAVTFNDSFEVALFPPVERLTTPERVAAKMHVAVPTDNPDLAALEEAIEEASGIVLNHLNRSSVATLTDARRSAVTSVTTRVAMRLWRNPADLSAENYGTGEVSMSYSDPRLLTGDEIRALSKSVSRVRGPILMTPARSE